MIRMGKTYGNLMVDVKTGSEKLKDRARRILSMVTGSRPRKQRALRPRSGTSRPIVMKQARLTPQAPAKAETIRRLDSRSARQNSRSRCRREKPKSGDSRYVGTTGSPAATRRASRTAHRGFHRAQRGRAPGSRDASCEPTQACIWGTARKIPPASTTRAIRHCSRLATDTRHRQLHCTRRR